MSFLSKFVSEDMKVSPRYKRGSKGAVQGEEEWGQMCLWKGQGEGIWPMGPWIQGGQQKLRLQKWLSTRIMGSHPIRQVSSAWHTWRYICSDVPAKCKGTGCGIKQTQALPHKHHLYAVRLWTTYLTFLSLILRICKLGS